MSLVIAILGSTVAWFLTAAVLFFNPPVDKAYNTEPVHPSVKVLPKSGSTIGKILAAVFLQCALWACVYTMVKPALGESALHRGLVFAGILTVVKLIPRDADRILLTTYPMRRMIIEFINGAICAVVVGLVFGYLL